MLNNTVIEEIIKSYDESLQNIKDFINKNPKYINLAEVLKGYLDTNNMMYRSLLIEYCSFNDNFIEAKIEKSHVNLNSAEIKVIETMKHLPDKFIKKIFFNKINENVANNISYEIRMLAVDEILKRSEKNLDLIVDPALDNTYDYITYLIDSSKMSKAIQISLGCFWSRNTDDMNEPLEEWKRHTEKIKSTFLNYLSLRKTQTAESMAATNLLNSLNVLVNTKMPFEQVLLRDLDRFGIELHESMKIIQMHMENTELFLIDLIGFESTYVFSDIDELQQKLENKINALIAYNIKNFDSSKKTISDKFIQLFTLFKDLLANVNVRALNLKLDYIPYFNVLLTERANQKSHLKQYCDNWKKRLNEYKELYTFANLPNDLGISTLVEFDWEQKITEMKIDEIKRLDNLLTKAIETFKNKIKDENISGKVTTLSADYKDAIPTSNDIRVKFVMFYGYYDTVNQIHVEQVPASEVIFAGKMESQCKIYFDDAKEKANSKWKTQTEKHTMNLKRSINNCFQGSIGDLLKLLEDDGGKDSLTKKLGTLEIR